MIGTQVIVLTNHLALKYLLQKKKGKLRLIKWVSLLQEFDMEIRDKKSSNNVVADHLFRPVTEENKANALPIQESFPDKQFFQVRTSNLLLAAQALPENISSQQKTKFLSEVKHYFFA